MGIHDADVKDAAFTTSHSRLTCISRLPTVVSTKKDAVERVPTTLGDLIQYRVSWQQSYRNLTPFRQARPLS